MQGRQLWGPGEELSGTELSALQLVEMCGKNNNNSVFFQSNCGTSCATPPDSPAEHMLLYAWWVQGHREGWTGWDYTEAEHALGSSGTLFPFWLKWPPESFNQPLWTKQERTTQSPLLSSSFDGTPFPIFVDDLLCSGITNPMPLIRPRLRSSLDLISYITSQRPQNANAARFVCWAAKDPPAHPHFVFLQIRWRMKMWISSGWTS